MSKRHVAVWIVCALVIGLIGPAAPPAAAAERGARIQAGLLRKLDTGKVDRFVVEFAARADLAAAGEHRPDAYGFGRRARGESSGGGCPLSSRTLVLASVRERHRAEDKFATAAPRGTAPAMPGSRRRSGRRTHPEV